MTTRRAAPLVAAALTLLTGTFVVLALGLPRVTGAAPLVVGVPTCLLFATEWLASARRSPPPDAQPSHSRAAAIGWMALLLALIWIGGLRIGAPAYLYFYLRYRSGESRLTALTAAAAAWSILVGVVDLVLGAPMPAGALWTGLGVV